MKVETQILKYGCTVEQIDSILKHSPVFCNYGPVDYTAYLIDKGLNLMKGNQPIEAEQIFNQAKWVLMTYIRGDNE
jgi:hypothetical protein